MASYRNGDNQRILNTIIGGRAGAYAQILGSPEYAGITGRVNFFPMLRGTMVVAQIYGLPTTQQSDIMPLNESRDCLRNPVFGFHIHAGDSCASRPGEPFYYAEGHFNPDDCQHPHHAGDLPPLFGNDGFALSAFYTNRFTIRDIIGRTVIIHNMPDDFSADPSGHSGVRIACGVVERNVV